MKYGIIIGGDIVPTKSNLKLFENGDIGELFGDTLVNILSSATYRIFNLECPLTNDKTPILKSGPSLSASNNVIKGIKSINPSLLTLANNHILDQGTPGLNSTVRCLNENNISFIGAGENLQKAQKPFFVEYCGKKIGVFACAEHEFSIATEDSAGANPMDLLETPDLVYKIKKNCDYLIVLYHGGKEYYRYPSPELQKRCRKLASKGADLVICQHSHCIGCMENFNDSTIVYGQGNFIFDGSEEECWQTSLLINIDENLKISFIPIVKKNHVVRVADSDEKENILNKFWERGEEIKEEGLIKYKYDEITKKEIDSYMLRLSGISSGFIYCVFNKLLFHKLTSFIIKSKYGTRKLLSIKNTVECEAHRELLINGITLKYINKNDSTE